MTTVTESTRDRALILPYVYRILPLVGEELNHWRKEAAAIPDETLRHQALASIEHKRFHCQGGSFFALYSTGKSRSLVRFIVALQTISDYLDNLCDRVDGACETGFRTLHGAMLAAVGAEAPSGDWYRDYPLRDDGGYLEGLVQTSRETVMSFPGYEGIRGELVHLVGLYSDLQVYKHMTRSRREETLLRWHRRHSDLAPGTMWWEFAAATGSTLAMFALAAAAAEGKVDPLAADRLVACYFPWICGIHILLDYFIDLDEDSIHGDLNFVAYYPSEQKTEEGLSRFLREAYRSAGSLPRPAFHKTVIHGLLALYLSDPKAGQSGRKKITQHLLRTGGAASFGLYHLCLLLRRKGTI
ncbi:MAG: tetraprenyl-beta-curcumene synthase family protein [Bacillota bacterium]|nr:tetraprenyl-beta-curcumene synthase family protein [Bacillota bacterium]MDW7684245.1 tetraprenyl-beta-curcumene synthase family protein [Bacillota bacterium]